MAAAASYYHAANSLDEIGLAYENIEKGQVRFHAVIRTY